MRVILKENVDKLGQVGDVVKVSAGYARNYLLPRKLVLIADEANILEVEHHRKVLQKKRDTDKKELEKFAEKLADFSCTISRKVGKGDKLFGSVGIADIADEMKKAGHEIQKTWIKLKEPLKSLGVHPVELRIHPEISVTLKVWIAKDEG